MTSVARCPACARPARSRDRFCGACGTAIAPTPGAEPLVCTDCGAIVEDEDDQFCTHCGARFEA